MTKHPERRAGQRWRMCSTELDADFEGTLVETGSFATWMLSDVVARDGKGDDRRFRADMWTHPGVTMTLISDAPAVAPVAADTCKAPEWCGIHRINSEPGRDRHFFSSTIGYVRRGDHLFCSDVCADIALPPLAAQSSETKRCHVIGCVNGSCVRCTANIDECAGYDDVVDAIRYAAQSKPAPQPEPAKVPVCLFFGKGKLHGGEIHKRYWRNMFRDVCSTTVCDYHYLTEIEPSGGGSDVLRNDKVPERIARPKLAHSYGIEDPALENA